jgi:cytoskeletal protein RodZ
MQSVGTRLKEAREKKGFSLEEINARTRINSRNLAAIESDEVRNISSPFFYRSFVRQYAEQVDIDFQVLAPAVEMLAGNMRQPDLPGQGGYLPVRVAPIQARPKQDFSWIVPAAIFLGFVMLISSAYAAWRHYAPLVHHATLVSSASTAPPVREIPAPAPKLPEPKFTVREVKSLSQAKVPVEAKPDGSIHSGSTHAESIHLELAATERTWLSVSADGKPAYTGILEPAQIKVLDGQEIAKVRTGNAGGTNITFNGKDIGTIGPRGKTRTVIFTKTGYSVQQADGATLQPANHIGG